MPIARVFSHGVMRELSHDGTTLVLSPGNGYGDYMYFHPTTTLAQAFDMMHRHRLW